MLRPESANDDRLLQPLLTSGVILFIGFALVGWWWLGVQRDAERQLRSALNVEAGQLALKLDDRMKAYEQVLMGLSGMMEQLPSLARRHWERYATHQGVQSRYPGILAMGFAKRLRPDELGAHISAVRADGFPEFTVRPAGNRPIYSSVTYVYPFNARNKLAFGYDMLSDPTRRSAMEDAAQSGGARLSGVVKLVIDTSDRHASGQLMYVPVYASDRRVTTPESRSDALLSWVYAAFTAEALISNLVEGRHDDLQVEFHDVHGTGKDLLHLANLGNNELKPSTHVVARHIVKIPVAGRTWELALSAHPEFARRITSGASMAILGLSLCACVLLAWLVFSILRSCDRATALAHSMTVELSRSQTMLHAILDAIPTP